MRVWMENRDKLVLFSHTGNMDGKGDKLILFPHTGKKDGENGEMHYFISYQEYGRGKGIS